MNAPFRILLVLVVVACGQTSALAQSQARMSGQVVDNEGSVVANATIRLAPKDKSGVAVEAKTKKDGKYFLGMIRPGSYGLVVSSISDRVLIHLKGKCVDGNDKSVLWEMDQDVSAANQPTVNVAAVNQVSIDLVVGPPALTAEGKAETAQKDSQDAYGDGLQRVRSGDYEGGLAKLEPLLAKTPDHAQTNYLVAFARHQLGREAEALDALNKVIAKEPEFTGAHVLRGRILQSQAHYEEAEAEYRREIAKSTDKNVRMESWSALAVMFEKTDRLPKAVETLEKAVAEEPRRELLLALADFYSKTGDREKAAATLERAENEAGGTDDAAMLNLAISYINDKKYDEAERLAIRVEGKNSSSPNKSLAHSILARCDLSRGKTAGGIEHLEKALALDPASPLAAENREILAALKKK